MKQADCSIYTYHKTRPLPRLMHSTDTRYDFSRRNFRRSDDDISVTFCHSSPPETSRYTEKWVNANIREWSDETKKATVKVGREVLILMMFSGFLRLGIWVFKSEVVWCTRCTFCVGTPRDWTLEGVTSNVCRRRPIFCDLDTIFCSLAQSTGLGPRYESPHLDICSQPMQQTYDVSNTSFSY